MTRWRFIILLILFGAPLVFLMGMGGYALWEYHWSFYAWWPMMLSFTLACILARYWQQKKQLLPTMNFERVPHGTERDQQAWQLVANRAKAAESIPSARFSELPFYWQTGQDMALEMARFYNPRADDPYGSLTVLEILAVTELASRDLSELVQRYVPGSHILTINDIRRARSLLDWYRKGRLAYWLVSAVFAPVETGVRYLASRYGMGSTWDLLQQNILLWFYTAYIHRLGTHLIELHSGRLRVGVDRYRELMAQYQAAQEPAAESTVIAETIPAAPPVPLVTISIIGQVKTGKSSLINALLGEQRALVDVLPVATEVTKYELQPANVPTKLTLLDTTGYGNEGPREDQLRATEDVCRGADLILLVLHARNPARQADALMLEKLARWFSQHPELRMPPVLGVLTHIDLLSPMMEWSPPYDWLNPKRPKEQQIQLALKTAQEQLPGMIAGVVPVCTALGKTFGIQEALLPAVAGKLGEARTVGLLRCLQAEADEGKIQKVFQQLLAAGKEAARAAWEHATK
ncbi:MAG TPA: GTPase [Gemmataceae bacterium]|nr:GTPase [Gemmataceae bacterium]